MTVKELRDQLHGVPDDLMVVTPASGWIGYDEITSISGVHITAALAEGGYKAANNGTKAVCLKTEFTE
jgi:hypothetical protein